MQAQNLLSDHIIICGLGHVGYRIAELLYSQCVPFVVLTSDIRPEWRETVEKCASVFLEANARQEGSLRAAGIETARAILIVTNNDLTNVEIALDAQRLNPGVKIIARISDRYLADRLERQRGVQNVLSPALLTAPVFVAAALGEQIIRAFNIQGCDVNILRLPIREYIADGSETAETFCARHDLALLATQSTHRKDESTKAEDDRFWEGSQQAPVQSHDSRPLKAGDEMIVAALAPATERLRKQGLIATRPAAHPATPSFVQTLVELLKRPLYPFRASRRAWRRASPILRKWFIGLVALTGASVLVFHAAMPGSPTWIDTFYFVITTMTTVGYGDFNLHHAPWWLKLYGCGIMIGGASLVAAWFGIITDYIVSARVEQALGRRSTDLRNHTVVIGLGDVGARVTEELHRIGEPIVAIDRTNEHAAVSLLQDRLHVIIGDAYETAILKQANIAQAHAIIVTTTNDLDSLRIAHQAESMNPALRSVVRIYDSSLAQKLGIGLGLDRTVNAAAIAAATFVACTLQSGVEQGFLLDNRLLLLRWVGVEAVVLRSGQPMTVQALRENGLQVMLWRRSGDTRETPHTALAHDVIQPGYKLLLLEEYFPDSRTCAAPKAAPSIETGIL